MRFMTVLRLYPKEQVVSLKLLVNTDTNKVLFAEADKDFVDILCSFLTLPLGTIARLLQKESSIGPVTIGCLNSLYQSVEKMGLLTNYNSSEDYCRTLRINFDDSQPTKYFICSKYEELDYQCTYLSIGSKNNYCFYGHPLSHSVSLSSSLKDFCLGFVKFNKSFVISDNLTVLPHSMDHTIFDLSNNFGIKSTSSIKEMTVNVTKGKVLDLLKCSLFSKTPLTDVFLGMKPRIERSRIFSDDVKTIFSDDINITVKLVIRKSDDIILYAQGGRDFAELIIRFLTFPLGGVLRNLEGNSSLGSIDGLCKSIADLNEEMYFISKDAKNRLLKISVLQYYCGKIFDLTLLKNEEDWRDRGNFRKMQLVNTIATLHAGSLGSFVKRPEMYVVTDDLIVEPLLSPVSSIHVLQRFKTPIDDLEEKVVTIGIKESHNIFKAALCSTSALTNGLRHLLTQIKKEK